MGAALVAACAAAPAAVLWGFTVDDALIPARYAHHLAIGEGYVFNRGGPVTDGVTPLGFAHLLAPFAGEGALAAFHVARVMGLALWLAGAAMIGERVAAMRGSCWRYASAATIAASAPLAAWASAGLETGIVTGLVASSVALRHGARLEPLGPVLLGLAAGWRPELFPFALVAGTVDARPREEGAPLALTRGHAARFALVALPFVCIAVIRGIVFGRAAPLAAVAKQSTLAAGAAYALACFLLTGPVAMLGAAAVWRALSGYVRWLAAAVLLHFVAVAIAGGDWMPLSRLVVPVLPAGALVVAAIGSAGDQPSHLRRWAPRVLFTAALAGQIFVWVGPGLRSRRVLADRMATIEGARPALAGARVIGTLDVGWVGVAAPEATVLDFAGVTDPMIAVLPGGHTSKPIPDALVAQRDPDALVLLLAGGAPLEADWTRSRFARGVEGWVALSPGVGEAMAPERVTEGRLRYVIVRKRGTSW